MKRIRLKAGHTFSVPGKAGTYTIRKTIGEGGSCVVYLADFNDGNGITTEHILKEYYPKKIAIFRDETGFLCAKTEEAKEAFDNGLEHFQSGYKKQSEIRRIVDLKNSTSNIQDVFKANGTEYIDMTCFNGRDYADAEEMYSLKNLGDICDHLHQPECAQKYYLEALKICEKIEGEESLSYLEFATELYCNLIRMYTDASTLDKAFRCLSEAITLYEDISLGLDGYNPAEDCLCEIEEAKAYYLEAVNRIG